MHQILSKKFDLFNLAKKISKIIHQLLKHFEKKKKKYFEVNSPLFSVKVVT